MDSVLAIGLCSHPRQESRHLGGTVIAEQWKSVGGTMWVEQWHSDGGTVWWNGGEVIVEQCGEKWNSVGGTVAQ